MKWITREHVKLRWRRLVECGILIALRGKAHSQ
jgi:hypothetical protein